MPVAAGALAGDTTAHDATMAATLDATTDALRGLTPREATTETGQTEPSRRHRTVRRGEAGGWRREGQTA